MEPIVLGEAANPDLVRSEQTRHPVIDGRHVQPFGIVLGCDRPAGG
jgi:hypothetical protein